VRCGLRGTLATQFVVNVLTIALPTEEYGKASRAALFTFAEMIDFKGDFALTAAKRP
jgi:hypothetical protein